VQTIIYLLSHYKYLVLLPLAIVEGPVIAIVAGFLCTKGLMEPVPAYFIIVTGDVTGDSLCYLLGRTGTPQFVKKAVRFFGINDKKMASAKSVFAHHPVKAVALSKIILGIGPAGIYMAGKTGVPFKKFLMICLFTSAIQYIFYLGSGLLFGQAYERINHYLNVFASLSIIAAFAILFFLSLKSIQKKI
jgi:membrane-associated protein